MKTIRSKSIWIAVVLFCLVNLSLFADKTHVIKTGDTLWDLAEKNYGDPTLYTVLLEVNNITNPRTILNGAVIVIPDKSKMQQIANETDPERKKTLINQINKGGSDTDANPRTKTKLNASDLSFDKILEGPQVPVDTLLKIEPEL